MNQGESKSDEGAASSIALLKDIGKTKVLSAIIINVFQLFNYFFVYPYRRKRFEAVEIYYKITPSLPTKCLIN